MIQTLDNCNYFGNPHTDAIKTVKLTVQTDRQDHYNPYSANMSATLF